MPDRPTSPPTTFTPAEREFIRRAFGQHFGSFPRIAEGVFLRTWRSGPQLGEPKLPPAVKTMLERGLVEVRPDGRLFRAHFTVAGVDPLRQLAANRRYLDRVQYAHIRRELGLEPAEDEIS
jgi:hypothetical protein